MKEFPDFYFEDCPIHPLKFSHEYIFADQRQVGFLDPRSQRAGSYKVL